MSSFSGTHPSITPENSLTRPNNFELIFDFPSLFEISKNLYCLFLQQHLLHKLHRLIFSYLSPYLISIIGLLFFHKIFCLISHNDVYNNFLSVQRGRPAKAYVPRWRRLSSKRASASMLWDWETPCISRKRTWLPSR